MSWFPAGQRRYNDYYWDRDLNCWWSTGDEYNEHVYHVELLDTWGEPYTEPWPEDMLEPGSVLDALLN